MRRSSSILAAAAVALAQFVVAATWSALGELPPPLGVLFLVHGAATPATLALLRRARWRTDLRDTPILGPSIAVSVVLMGCVGVGMLHDFLEATLSRLLPGWSGVVVFLSAVFLAALLGLVLQGSARPEGQAG